VEKRQTEKFVYPSIVIFLFFTTIISIILTAYHLHEAWAPYNLHKDLYKDDSLKIEEIQNFYIDYSTPYSYYLLYSYINYCLVMFPLFYITAYAGILDSKWCAREVREYTKMEDSLKPEWFKSFHREMIRRTSKFLLLPGIMVILILFECYIGELTLANFAFITAIIVFVFAFVAQLFCIFYLLLKYEQVITEIKANNYFNTEEISNYSAYNFLKELHSNSFITIVVIIIINAGGVFVLESARSWLKEDQNITINPEPTSPTVPLK
ncbi:MAG: hypothetical protein SFY68_06040, partial [Candidatus Sumerlaeia bacterium]|nr:hypothetical protein [Candidatus Sumerlaeia bacterium]